MTNSDRIKTILRKYPEARHRRGIFAWWYGVEYYDFNQVINATTKDEFIVFFQDWAGIERQYREVLKDPEFKLSPEEEAKRFERASEFSKEYAKK